MYKIPSFRFTANLNKFLIISGAFMAAILVGIFVFGVSLDIQFKGGSIITYVYEGNLDANEFGRMVDEITSSATSLQQSENIATGQQTLILSLPGDQSLTSDEMTSLNDQIRQAYPENNIQTLEISNVAPVIGKEFLFKSLLAVGVALILMMVYIAFRFRKIGGISAGAMAVVALLHDIAIVFGTFILFRIPLNDNFIAVVLTILGYSLNDTVVIYDRVRENERIYGKSKSQEEFVDLSINQSLKRSLVISVCTVVVMIIVTVVALLYGVDSIISFSFPMIIGLVSGSYSTICLAGPLWVKWQEHKEKNPAK